jgi:hypothetical protein
MGSTGIIYQYTQFLPAVSYNIVVILFTYPYVIITKYIVAIIIWLLGQLKKRKIAF